MDRFAPLLDDDAAYQALTARDARFDGRLYVGVTSTGIYCRPICRVRTPMRKNCRFFQTPAQAEAQSFRPCMKCRPEIAPGAGLAWTVMDASRTLARQASAALDAQAASGDIPRLAELAARMGLSDRHLRRIFQTEHGVSPVQYLQTRRLLLAKQLLTDTRLPVSSVASASGFGSVRRFNAAFSEHYRMSPTRLRSAVGNVAFDADAALAVTLAYRAPCDVEALLRFFAQRAIPGITQVAGRTVRCSLRAGSVAAVAGWIEAEFVVGAPLVRLRFAAELASASAAVNAAVRRWLDLDADPHAIDAALADLPGAPGLRLPGSLDAFELCVRAVLGQQISVATACTLARRLVERFGAAIVTPWADLNRSFPAPPTLAAAPLDAIAELGVIRSRAAAIQALAGDWPAIAALLAPAAGAPALIERLCALPGIGPWTAHYIAMRTLGWPDAFPPNDVALLKAMRLRYGPLTPRAALAHASNWQPWRSYAVLRLWNSLQEDLV